MSVAIITGSAGLIGSETVRFFHEKGLDIIGIDNNLREYFFGHESSTEWNTKKLQSELKNFTHKNIDIRDKDKVFQLFKEYNKDISVIIHTAAQPSHDWAAREPFTDFSVNAVGTLNLLEATRQFCLKASFIFTSTNKVYGDRSNELPLIENETRWELDPANPWARHGFDEKLSIDQSKHSLFGASKVAADILVQEYGRYFDMNTVAFRGGCLTGPAHSGAELHGFLSYLVKCGLTGKKYTVYGYKGKQVRDNIHSYDLVNCFWHYFNDPKVGKVYNIGGSRHSNCSILEAINMIEGFTGKKMNFDISPENRSGDHIWWISDVRAFKFDYPQWDYKYNLEIIVKQIVEATSERLGQC